MGVPNHQQEYKGVQKYNQHFLHVWLLSHDNKPHISYVSSKQRKKT